MKICWQIKEQIFLNSQDEFKDITFTRYRFVTGTPINYLNAILFPIIFCIPFKSKPRRYFTIFKNLN